MANERPLIAGVDVYALFGAETTYGTAIYGGATIIDKYIACPQNKIHNRFSIMLTHRIPGQSIIFYNYDIVYQVKGFDLR